MWKSGLCKLKRQALEEGPQKSQKEQGYTDTGIVASSTNALHFFAVWVGEQYLNLSQFHC